MEVVVRRTNYALILVFGIAFGLGAGSSLAATARLPRTERAISSTREGGPLPPLKRHPVVALTFDDLPASGGLSPDETRLGILTRLAEELKANHLRGTYGFVTGNDLPGDSDSQEALRSWVRLGMNIGNHTWSHPSLTTSTPADFEHEIALNEPILRAYAGKRDWHWFRYPYLEEGETPGKRDAVRDWLHAHGYRIAEVTLTFEDDDWSDPYDRCRARHDVADIAWLKQSYLENAAEFIRLGREEEQIAFGHEIPSVLVLHATAMTTLMLPSLLDQLRAEGFRFTSLERVERNPAYALDPGVGIADGGPMTNEFLNARHLKYPPFKPEPVQRLNSICE